MENPILEAKTDLIKWISNLDDLEVLSELINFKEKNKFADCFEESRAEYILQDEDFDERFAKGIPHDEMRKRTSTFISSLPWKK
ncbi:hypothetical protein [Halpernia sp.]|uniref:hypothetical protein n=1 Tax=Halpernia sp. TaxID=2782209 RepID=UPI003A8E822B